MSHGVRVSCKELQEEEQKRAWHTCSRALLVRAACVHVSRKCKLATRLSLRAAPKSPRAEPKSRAQEQSPRAQEQSPRAQEQRSRAQEQSPRAELKSRAQEQSSRAEPKSRRAQEQSPRVEPKSPRAEPKGRVQAGRFWVHSGHRNAVYTMCSVGQNRVYAPYMTVDLVNFLPKMPYTHHIYMVLANFINVSPDV